VSTNIWNGLCLVFVFEFEFEFEFGVLAFVESRCY